MERPRIAYNYLMITQSRDDEPRLDRAHADRLARLAPLPYASALGIVAAAGGLIAGVAAGLPAGDTGLLALRGLVSGAGAGVLIAVVRNLLVAVYLRFVWTRLQHHVANDLLDRVS